MMPMKSVPSSHESASEMTKEMQKPRAMEVESMTIRPAENGGFIATCSKRPEKKANGPREIGMYESKEYAFTSLAEVQAFMAKELGATAEEDDEEAV